MTSSAPLERLFALEAHGITLGLDVMHALCKAVDHPQKTFPSIIVAGTNGKGSVAAMIETGLRAAGHHTGRYTSPHLLELEERFAVDGRPVSRADVEHGAQRVLDAIDHLQTSQALSRPATFFEATTLLAFLLFRRAAVDTAVLEVGMGGRFDATNVVAPICAVITTIDLDHTEYLGNSLAQIAFEKAGVIKADTPVVVGETKPEALAVLRDVARSCGAPFSHAIEDVAVSATYRDGVATATFTTSTGRYGPLTLGLPGRHQTANAAMAIRALESLTIKGSPIAAEAIVTGLTDVNWPGRLQQIKIEHDRSIVLDAAHNAAAAQVLAQFLAEAYPARLPLVFGALSDKDVAAMTRVLAPAISRMICTAIPASRAMSPESIAHIAHATVPTLDVTTEMTPDAALRDAWATHPTVCVAGSLYLVGAVMKCAASWQTRGVPRPR